MNKYEKMNNKLLKVLEELISLEEEKINTLKAKLAEIKNEEIIEDLDRESLEHKKMSNSDHSWVSVDNLPK